MNCSCERMGHGEKKCHKRISRILKCQKFKSFMYLCAKIVMNERIRARARAHAVRWCRRDESERCGVCNVQIKEQKNEAKNKTRRQNLAPIPSSNRDIRPDKPFTATQTRTRNTQAKPHKHKKTIRFTLSFFLFLSFHCAMHFFSTRFIPLSQNSFMRSVFPKLIPGYTRVYIINSSEWKNETKRKNLYWTNTMFVAWKSCAKASNRRVFSLAFCYNGWRIVIVYCFFVHHFVPFSKRFTVCPALAWFYLAKIQL